MLEGWGVGIKELVRKGFQGSVCAVDRAMVDGRLMKFQGSGVPA